jgi:hypothetical protein
MDAQKGGPMAGISKHYILGSTRDDGTSKYIDKKAYANLLRIVTGRVTNASSQISAAEIQTLHTIEAMNCGWRKKLVPLWDLAKKMARVKNPWGFKLTEYRVRKGRSLNAPNVFKTMCAMNRIFRPNNPKPVKLPAVPRFRMPPPPTVRTVRYTMNTQGLIAPAPDVDRDPPPAPAPQTNAVPNGDTWARLQRELGRTNVADPARWGDDPVATMDELINNPRRR